MKLVKCRLKVDRRQGASGSSLRRTAKHRRGHPGVVILCVLACLVVVSTMAICNLQFALRGRAATRGQLHLRQAELLCRAGIERVQSQLKGNAQEINDQWQPELSTSSPMQCVVTTRAQRDESQTMWRIRSTARLVNSAQPLQAYQRTEEIYLPLSQNQNVQSENE